MTTLEIVLSAALGASVLANKLIYASYASQRDERKCAERCSDAYRENADRLWRQRETARACAATWKLLAKLQRRVRGSKIVSAKVRLETMDVGDRFVSSTGAALTVVRAAMPNGQVIAHDHADNWVSIPSTALVALIGGTK